MASPLADTPRHVKVTVYMPPDMLADLDATRIDMRRVLGVNVDRGRLIRAAILTARDDINKWEYHVDEEG